MSDIETFDDLEKLYYQRSIENLKKIFVNGPRYGNAVNLLISEIIERRKPKCKHSNVGQMYPDWEGLNHAMDVKTAVESFKYLWVRQFYCNDCKASVTPTKYILKEDNNANNG